MWNYNTSISAELPECLMTTYSKKNLPTPPRRTLSKHHFPPIFSDVSPDAPAYFHNSFSSRPKAHLDRSLSPPKFQYEDMKASKPDLSTVRPKQYFDMLKSLNQGAKNRLPYYQEYYKTLEQTGFGIHEGMCTSGIKQRAAEISRVQKTDPKLMRSMSALL